MRFAILLAVVSGCTSPLYSRASTRLGVSGKRLHLKDHDRVDDRDVYVFCRAEHLHELGAARRYDAACVTYVCPIGREHGCDES